MKWKQAINIMRFMMRGAAEHGEEGLVLVTEDHDGRAYVHVLDANVENKTKVSTEKLEALIGNAAKCLLIHNHPAGHPQASPADLEAAEHFEALCRKMNVIGACAVMCSNRIRYIFNG